MLVVFTEEIPIRVQATSDRDAVVAWLEKDGAFEPRDGSA